MNPCDSIQTDLDAYRDGELDETRSEQIQQHLEHCPTCDSAMKQARYIENMIKETSLRWTPPAALWSRIQHSAEQRAPSENAVPRRRGLRYGWAVAAMLVLGIILFNVNLVNQDTSQFNEPVASVLVNEFHTFVISHRNLDYVDRQPEAIRQWISGKVDFRAPEPVKSQSMQLEGGRLCNMLNQRVASYMYRSDGAWVSLYIMQPEPAGIDQTGTAETVVQGYGFIDWQRDGLYYSLVGDIDVARLRRFAEELKSI